jgi:hypothetical protein
MNTKLPKYLYVFIRINLIVLNSSPMFLFLSPGSKMVRNIKIGWKLTKLWKTWGAPKNNTDLSHVFSMKSYGTNPTGFFWIVCLIPFSTRKAWMKKHWEHELFIIRLNLFWEVYVTFTVYLFRSKSVPVSIQLYFVLVHSELAIKMSQ